VQYQSVPLQGFKGKRDFITAALNRVQGQVVAEELGSFEGGDVLFLFCRETEDEINVYGINVIAALAVDFDTPTTSKHQQSHLHQRNVTRSCMEEQMCAVEWMPGACTLSAGIRHTYHMYLLAGEHGW